MQHTDSAAPMKIAEERGIYAFGQALTKRHGPNAQLTAIIDDWAPYTSSVDEAINGSWSSTDTWGGFDTGMVALPYGKAVPDDVKAMAEEAHKANLRAASCIHGTSQQARWVTLVKSRRDC